MFALREKTAEVSVLQNVVSIRVQEREYLQQHFLGEVGACKLVIDDARHEVTEQQVPKLSLVKRLKGFRRQIEKLRDVLSKFICLCLDTTRPGLRRDDRSALRLGFAVKIVQQVQQIFAFRSGYGRLNASSATRLGGEHG